MRQWTIIFAIIATTAAWAEPPVLSSWRTEDDFYARFGSNRNVELVAALLADKDFAIRENAVMDLGDMGNFTAIEHIRKAAGDENTIVRAAAALAASKYPADRAGDIVTSLLADPDMTVTLAALRGVRMLTLESATADVAKLVASD
ncbi:MAG: HEAT repeat domain-containing protein, partial [Phycisphaerae bacterium]|nr:HEAT repeat domain-containing protein [Phycisphaerae bacterium]